MMLELRVLIFEGFFFFEVFLTPILHAQEIGERSYYYVDDFRDCKDSKHNLTGTTQCLINK